ncbi:glycoside hydrolase family 127 protein [Niastella populi]|uniref:Glycosyl hydrolase n=1 Tax=Niastella populi TaxID=550983 RepID=A0A1V9FKN0_9BACT|nr:glycoside hydrolase family 127 protein [Niastella populi]OQP58908.1 glycosyl hydrolase [Niastella populi]
MKRFAITAMMGLPLFTAAQGPVATFKPTQIQLQPGIFKEAENTDLKYIMSLNPDRLLAPFLREAGLTPKAASYPNWENTGLDGHIGGHYLSALSLMYASTGDKKVLERLNYMLTELKKCQDKNGDGYIGGVPGSKTFWAELAANKVTVGSFDINKKWVPFYNIHKTFAGLKDAWLHANSGLAKKMLIAYSNWLLNTTKGLSDSDIQHLLRSEHGGMNEVLAEVSVITGDKKYLELARRFSHQIIKEPLANRQDKLTGMHANTQIPKIIGFERIAGLSGDSTYHIAARFFWETVVNNRTVAIGGHGVREHFHPPDNFSSMTTSEQGPETCNSYNMLKLSKALYESEGLAKYIDYYERTQYNHILSSQHPEKGGFVYFTPMRPGHYRVYSQPETSFWCCVGSGLENHAKYNELIYAHTANALYVNLFIPSKVNWQQQGVVLSQQTRFPDEETTTLTIDAVKKPDFTLKVRYPVWVAPNAMVVTVNGEKVNYNAQPASFIAIKRKWKKGDKITVTLPMRTTTEQMPGGSDYVAVLHGPIVLAAKTGTSDLTGIYADDSRGGHIANGKKYPVQQMPMFVSPNANIAQQIKAVPGKNFTYTASELIYPENAKALELIPFFRLHDARYVIYWRQLSPEKLQVEQQRIAEEEAAKQKLDAITLDMVTAGEQQPESDHFIESEHSGTGSFNDRHWRDAKGWFSYKLTDKEKKADRLQVTYAGRDKDRRFTILVNNQPVQEVTLTGNNDNSFYTVDYPLPPALVQQGNGTLTVKFQAAAGSVAGGVYEVRLLKK